MVPSIKLVLELAVRSQPPSHSPRVLILYFLGFFRFPHLVMGHPLGRCMIKESKKAWHSPSLVTLFVTGPVFPAHSPQGVPPGQAQLLPSSGRRSVPAWLLWSEASFPLSLEIATSYFKWLEPLHEIWQHVNQPTHL